MRAEILQRLLNWEGSEGKLSYLNRAAPEADSSGVASTPSFIS